MLSMDKLQNTIPREVISTINELAALQNIETLKKWLNDCQTEIDRRQELKENTYSLYCEKYYLESVLGGS